MLTQMNSIISYRVRSLVFLMRLSVSLYCFVKQVEYTLKWDTLFSQKKEKKERGTPKIKNKNRLCSSSHCLPADPVRWDAMQGKEGELKVVCGAWSFFAIPPLYTFPICSLRQRRGAEGGGWGAEGAQVELCQIIHSLCQQGHALLHGTGVTCQSQVVISVGSDRNHGNSGNCKYSV